MPGTFSEKLKRARSNAGMSMDDLAELLDLSKQSVYKYEKNLLTPNPEALNKIARILNVTINDLFDNTRKERLQNISFRSGVEEAMIKLSQIEDEIIDEIELLTELERLSKDTIEFVNPLTKEFQISKIGDVEKAAEKLREKWNLGEIPIANVVEVIETRGICVIQKYSFYQFDGFSAFYKQRPIIVLNTRTEEITRRRFTSLHELGHIILGSLVTEKMQERIEEICNVFAGALLLPAKVLRKFWEGRKSFLMHDFIHIKESFGISIQAIWSRAISLSLLSWDTYHKWKDAYEVQTNYGNFNGNETPKRIESLIFRCISAGKLTTEKALAKAKKLKNNLDKTIMLNMEYNLTT